MLKNTTIYIISHRSTAEDIICCDLHVIN